MASETMLLHANSARHPEYGYVGTLDDEDAARARNLAPDTLYKSIGSDHVTHSYSPEPFVDAVEEFMAHLV